MYLPTVHTVRYFSSVILLPTGRQNIYCKADPNICEVYFILTAHVHTLPTTYWTFYFSRKYTIYLPDNLKTGFDVVQYYFSNPWSDTRPWAAFVVARGSAGNLATAFERT
jgi:hypothetical protein